MHILDSHSLLPSEDPASDIPSQYFPPSSLVFPYVGSPRRTSALFLNFYRSKTTAAGKVGFSSYTYSSDLRVTFIAIKFKSRTNLGLSAFTAKRDYDRYSALCEEFSKGAPGLASSCFQTSEFWVRIFIEIVAVSGSLWGILTSVMLCFAAIAVFTGHLGLSVVMISVVVAVIIAVAGVFWAAGFELGAVEAISLSVLIGTSCDYAAHLIEVSNAT